MRGREAESLRFERMISIVRSHHGGLAIGASLAGRGLWLQREPHCHRWRIWSTRVPRAAAGGGAGGDGQAGGGVREPRRPRPGDHGGQVALDPP